MDLTPNTLAQAAALWGVEAEYWDIFGERHVASGALLERILKSLGVDTSSEAALQNAVAARKAAEASRLLPHTIVVTQSERRVMIRRPPGTDSMPVEVSIEIEDGAAVMAQADAGESSFDLPDLPLGYYGITAVCGGVTTHAALIIGPDRAWQPPVERAGGVAVSLYGLRSARNWGAGDFTDLEVFLKWAASAGAGFVSLNPLHAIANRAPYNTSPYLPDSVLYRNFIYLDVERLPEFDRCSWAQHLRHSPSIESEINELRAAPYVEYERVARLKRVFLKLLFRTFLRDGGATDQRFREYLVQEGEPLRLFATHAALDEAMHARDRNVWNWSGWPDEFQDPTSAEVAEFAGSHWRCILFYQWVQWRIDRQLERAQATALRLGMPIGLYHDLALAVDKFGADVWAYRRFFVDGCRVGAPPDGFSPKGQDWGFPPPNSIAHFEDGYRLLSAAIRKNSRHGGALRIDHVMRFFRLYWIPNDMDATQGTYVTDRYEDLIRVLALESVHNRTVIVGEDLGTVPDIAREMLARFGILSYRLFYFERDNAGRFLRPDAYPAQALVSVSTHDLPTLAGFWAARDVEARRDAGILSDDALYHHLLAEREREKQNMVQVLRECGLLAPDADCSSFNGDLHHAITGFLARTPSRLFVLNQEDIFKDAEQQNLPATTSEYPNWRHKMKYALEELDSGIPEACTAMFRGWLEASGRLNPAPVS
jgi:4-alpha-glucanotransferase